MARPIQPMSTTGTDSSRLPTFFFIIIITVIERRRPTRISWSHSPAFFSRDFWIMTWHTMSCFRDDAILGRRIRAIRRLGFLRVCFYNISKRRRGRMLWVVIDSEILWSCFSRFSSVAKQSISSVGNHLTFRFHAASCSCTALTVNTSHCGSALEAHDLTMQSDSILDKRWLATILGM